MQTFLPYPSFVDSARCLDLQRLGKQRVEAKQILTALTDPSYGWQNHPAVEMWRGHEFALAEYGIVVCETWRAQGHHDSLLQEFVGAVSAHAAANRNKPLWFGYGPFHASHRSNLLRKDPEWYGRLEWTEPPTLPYYWPSQHKEFQTV